MKQKNYNEIIVFVSQLIVSVGYFCLALSWWYFCKNNIDISQFKHAVMLLCIYLLFIANGMYWFPWKQIETFIQVKEKKND